MPDRWEILGQFKVRDTAKFLAKANDLCWGGFKRNPVGYVYGIGQHSDQLEAVQSLVQSHLQGREFAIFRIDHGEDPDEKTGIESHTRYEKVFADRIEPTVYSDDGVRRN